MEYPHAYLTVSPLDGCNKACSHCYRTAVPSDHGFRLSRDDAYRSIDDASALGTACIFVGGEPTIWADGDSDYIDPGEHPVRRMQRLPEAEGAWPAGHDQCPPPRWVARFR